ncbi:MAG: fumarate hydratase [Candidatus Margulisbacteria bacterium]|nr:fumarate hydratase [Candidatus Margulisiibacteriota bacterium]MBU1022388.1 fumarate hydratase [Candidatus Margulisiibacteriota bacterium]MBU1729060.1 fumarate hydratase [Candidatus Margulisiibacteriota bacterium]MBU1954519.1 fumarate hydratase [Candidatus Margulisiibacteriota bacterium]
MRTVKTAQITKTIADLCIRANYELSSDVLCALKSALRKETNSTAKDILKQLIENASIARRERIPICQDTGFAVVLVELGQDVKIAGGTLEKAINDGVKLGYKKGYLRKSIVAHPLDRKNTKTNIPAHIHIDHVPGNKIKIKFMAKGGGAENCSQIKLFKPTASEKEIKAFIVDVVKQAGASACPPLIIGIGKGGTFDKAVFLAKKSLFRKIGSKNRDKISARLEKELLAEINKTGIGPAGLGGNTTALAVFIEPFPCHIASLPVAVNIECHAHRVKEAII